MTYKRRKVDPRDLHVVPLAEKLARVAETLKDANGSKSTDAIPEGRMTAKQYRQALRAERAARREADSRAVVQASLDQALAQPGEPASSFLEGGQIDVFVASPQTPGENLRESGTEITSLVVEDPHGVLTEFAESLRDVFTELPFTSVARGRKTDWVVPNHGNLGAEFGLPLFEPDPTEEDLARGNRLFDDGVLGRIIETATSANPTPHERVFPTVRGERG